MTHTIATQEEWLEARRALLAREKEATKLAGELARQRQALPWVRVDKPYAFATDAGEQTLAQLFDGRSQLLVYHFMFGPDWDAGCEGCSLVADHFDGGMVHLNQRDVTMTCVSRAPALRAPSRIARRSWSSI